MTSSFDAAIFGLVDDLQLMDSHMSVDTLRNKSNLQSKFVRRKKQILYVCPCNVCTRRRLVELGKTILESTGFLPEPKFSKRKRKTPTKMMGVFKDVRDFRRHVLGVLEKTANIDALDLNQQHIDEFHNCSGEQTFICPFDSCKMKFSNSDKKVAISQMISHMLVGHAPNVILINTLEESQKAHRRQSIETQKLPPFVFKTLDVHVSIRGFKPMAWVSKYDIYKHSTMATQNIQRSLYFSCVGCGCVFHLESFYTKHVCVGSFEEEKPKISFENLNLYKEGFVKISENLSLDKT